VTGVAVTPCLSPYLAAARFPIIKTLDQFNWNWPRKINQAQVQNLFRLAFLKDKTNVIFIGGVGLGKTHLATALAHTACLDGQTVLFTSAIEAINSLSAAQAQSRLKAQLKNLSLTSWVIFQSTRTVLTCFSRSSALVTRKAPC